MNILQTNAFKRKVKKFHAAQKKVLDTEVKKIIAQPEIGQLKTGDLSHVRVHKFKQSEKLYLLAYQVFDNEITLLAIGSHENFYRDLK